MDLQKNFKRQVLGVSLAIMGIAFVLSVGSNVLAQTADSATSAEAVSADAVATDVAVDETATPAASSDSGSGLSRKIKGSEGIPNIDPGKFLRGIWESTGISKIISTKGAPAKTDADDVDLYKQPTSKEEYNEMMGKVQEMTTADNDLPKTTINKLRVAIQDPNANDEVLSEIVEESANHVKDWGTAPGWQSLIMMAVGFLIV